MRDAASANTWAYAALSQILTAVLIGLSALAIGFVMPPIIALWPWFAVTVILNVATNIFQYEALRTAEISFFTILASSRVLVSMVAAWLVLNEHITLLQGFGSIVMLAAIVIAFSRHFKLQYERWMTFTLLYALSSGFIFIADARIVGASESVVSYQFFAFLLPGLATIFIHPKTVVDVVRIACSKEIIRMTIYSALYGIMCVTLWLAYQHGALASQLAPIRQSAIILTLIIATLFLNERSHFGRKLIASLLAVLSVYLISAA